MLIAFCFFTRYLTSSFELYTLLSITILEVTHNKILYAEGNMIGRYTSGMEFSSKYVVEEM